MRMTCDKEWFEPVRHTIHVLYRHIVCTVETRLSEHHLIGMAEIFEYQNELYVHPIIQEPLHANDVQSFYKCTSFRRNAVDLYSCYWMAWLILVPEYFSHPDENEVGTSGVGVRIICIYMYM